MAGAVHHSSGRLPLCRLSDLLSHLEFGKWKKMFPTIFSPNLSGADGANSDVLLAGVLRPVNHEIQEEDPRAEETGLPVLSGDVQPQPGDSECGRH